MLYDETLARKILAMLARVFPRKLHLYELKASLPEHQGLPAQEWLSAVQALRLDRKLDGKFLEDGTSIADAAALYITERGRRGLRETEGARREAMPGLRVFMCHSSGDRAVVLALYHKLKRDSFAPWLDEEDLLPGQEWESEIRRAVRATGVVVVCLSRSSITKEGYVQKEIKLALDVAEEKPERTIFLIPARLEECTVPERLVAWQWVDLFEDRGYERLVAALRAREEQLHGRPDASAARRSAGPRASDAKLGPPISLAEQMRRALAEHGTTEEAARVQQQRQAELREAARKAGPAQFDTLALLLRAKGETLNNENLPGFPTFKYAPVNHRLDAGKYAVELSPYAAFDSYSVRILAGLHPSAAQFMPEVPDIPTGEQRLLASMDQDGFSWRDPDGRKCDVNTVLDQAMETVCGLILEDIRRR
jgi:hypothetical protein